jgi:hypothetical protein
LGQGKGRGYCILEGLLRSFKHHFRSKQSTAHLTAALYNTMSIKLLKSVPLFKKVCLIGDPSLTAFF